jgi:hypothetical protein
MKRILMRALFLAALAAASLAALPMLAAFSDPDADPSS